MAKRVIESADTTPGSIALSAKVKLSISLILVFHLLAVIAEPFALFTRGANAVSPAASPIRKNLAAYVEFGYLNHGYFFFAPNPGPSHLLECILKSANGDQSRLRLPDRRTQWPRLLYHRHFMLAEFLHQLHVDAITEQDEASAPNKELLNAWRSERARYEWVRDSMIKHLKHRYGVDSAEIFRLEHRLPSDIEVFRDKIPLNDERLYVVLPDVSIVAPTSGPIPEAIPGDTKAGKSIMETELGTTEKGRQ